MGGGAATQSGGLAGDAATAGGFLRPPAAEARTTSVASSEPSGPKAEQIRLALRVILHLSRIGRPWPDEIARPESTQQGIADALQVTQGAISKVLHQLAAVEVVGHSRRHVRGQDRRVHAYFVTVKGEELARRYQEKYGDQPPPL